MMIGVAQVMGMKPTLRSFFSIGPAWANASVAVSSGKNCERAASAVVAPDRLEEGPARLVVREHGAHDRRGDHALVALLLARGDALEREARRVIVLGLARVAPADAAWLQPKLGIEGVVEGRHEGALRAGRRSRTGDAEHCLQRLCQRSPNALNNYFQ